MEKSDEYEKKREEMKKITSLTQEGYTGALDGHTLWIDTENGIIKFPIKDYDLAWRFYCKKLKITIEIVEED